MQLSGKRVLVVGLGRSGVAAALFLQSHGARVTVSDTKSEDQLREHIPALLDAGIAVETGGHGQRTFQDQDLIVVSPGVPVDAEPLVQARALGQPVIGEIELASQFLPGPIIAITGSNGKTTTTALVGEILSASGLKTLVGGNIGTAAISLAERATSESYVVLEVSSFQLETISSFRPNVAVVLNVSPDHLDRHGTFARYVAAKARIFENQTPEDFAVLNADDPICLDLGTRTRAQVFWFSRKHPVESGAFVAEGTLVFRRDRSEQPLMAVSEIPLKGAHNLENVLAAVSASALAGCAPQKIGAAVRQFKAVEHRLEYVATVGGVEYYNDSKATNVDATLKALESFPANIHLVVGGKDKGSDYTVLSDLLRERVKRVYTIGDAAEKIRSQIKDAATVVACGTLDAAVQEAAAAARPGDVVLLAPACASFDQFHNFEHRGRVFKKLVDDLRRHAR
jgi:UDP-N-acetylmuramoylalanine--D-glutamate ligase